MQQRRFRALELGYGAFEVLDLPLLVGEGLGAGEGRQFVHRRAQGVAEG